MRARYGSRWVEPRLPRDGSRWTEHPFPATFNSVAVDEKNVKWFATSAGVRRFDGAEWTTYTPENSGLAGNTVVSCCASDGKVYFAVEESYGEYLTGFAICSFDGSAWKTWRPDSNWFMAPKERECN